MNEPIKRFAERVIITAIFTFAFSLADWRLFKPLIVFNPCNLMLDLPERLKRLEALPAKEGEKRPEDRPPIINRSHP